MLHLILLLFLEISELEFVIGFGLFICLLLTIFIALFLITSYKRKIRYKQQLIKLDFEKNQVLLETQIEIQEQTLKTIAEEIHDNIGQVLSLAKLNLNTFPVIADVAIQTRIEDTKNLVSKAILDLRNLSRSLHGDKFNDLGLEEAIASELKILQNTGQFTTNLLITGSPYKLEAQKEMVLFRMVQEALNNAIKHSRAKNIDVQLQYDPHTFMLTIKDNGIGFSITTLPSASTGIGLKSMQNRAAFIGGIFSVLSETEKGTAISIEIKNSQPIV